MVVQKPGEVTGELQPGEVLPMRPGEKLTALGGGGRRGEEVEGVGVGERAVQQEG